MREQQSESSTLVLRAIIDHELRHFPVKNDLMIGSDPQCDVVVPGARPHHAFVRIEECVTQLIQCLEEDETTADSIILRADSIFVIGQTIFDCVLAVKPKEESSESEFIRRACPRCRASLLAVDLSAKFCPHCGGPLPPDCPEWPLVAPDSAPAPEPRVRWWMAWMPLWLRTRVARDPLFFARRTTVLAYINTLFNMGLKYEAGVDAERQLPEAMRYYRKAAHLGSLPARARLKTKEGATFNAQRSTSNVQ